MDAFAFFLFFITIALIIITIFMKICMLFFIEAADESVIESRDHLQSTDLPPGGDNPWFLIGSVKTFFLSVFACIFF